MYVSNIEDYFAGRKPFEESIGSFIKEDLEFVDNGANYKGADIKTFFETSWKPYLSGMSLKVMNQFRPFMTNKMVISLAAFGEFHIDCMMGIATGAHVLEFAEVGSVLKVAKMTHYYDLPNKTLACLSKLQGMEDGAEKKQEL
ncbi:expressed unknown protein [Seminavis robusta]|uniref:Uncharacterized protein n=1 Tax=Seminavis robusta TaxID=568900 RepID=A0A9N8DHW2_9STRA|nr:expressed unknown protein [Seminavis robusta]|eukprot:Sro136_g063970.1 n/a (143) ;mRNA; f:15095-15523